MQCKGFKDFSEHGIIISVSVMIPLLADQESEEHVCWSTSVGKIEKIHGLRSSKPCDNVGRLSLACLRFRGPETNVHRKTFLDQVVGIR